MSAHWLMQEITLQRILHCIDPGRAGFPVCGAAGREDENRVDDGSPDTWIQASGLTSKDPQQAPSEGSS